MLCAGICPAVAGVQNHHHIGKVLRDALPASETRGFKQCRLVTFAVGIALRQVTAGEVVERYIYLLTRVDVPHIADAAAPRDEPAGLQNVLVVLEVRVPRHHGAVKRFAFF